MNTIYAKLPTHTTNCRRTSQRRTPSMRGARSHLVLGAPNFGDISASPWPRRVSFPAGPSPARVTPGHRTGVNGLQRTDDLPDDDADVVHKIRQEDSLRERRNGNPRDKKLLSARRGVIGQSNNERLPTWRVILSGRCLAWRFQDLADHGRTELTGNKRTAFKRSETPRDQQNPPSV